MVGFMMDLKEVQNKIPEILSLVEKVTSANKMYFSFVLIGDQESIYLSKTEKYKSLW